MCVRPPFATAATYALVPDFLAGYVNTNKRQDQGAMLS
jgi:hypothetical protein